MTYIARRFSHEKRVVHLDTLDPTLGLEYNFLIDSSSVIGDATVNAPNLTFSRASAGRSHDSSGNVVSDGTDGPRFIHDPAASNARIGLLIEGARTNSLLQSRDLDTSWGTGGSPTLVKDEIGADGVANSAWTVGDDVDGFEEIHQNITISDDGATHCAWIRIKKDTDTSRFPEFAINISGGSRVDLDQHLNTQTGATANRTSTGTNNSGVIDEGDWWKWWLTMQNNNSGNTLLEIFLYPAITDSIGGTNTATTGEIIVDQIQVELNSTFPSSDIYTTTATVTRAKDICSTTNVLHHNADEGTLYASARYVVASAQERTLVTVDDGDTSDQLRLYMDASENLNFETVHGSDTDGASDGAAVIATETVVEAIGAYADDDVIASVDGTLSAADSTAAHPVASAATTLRIGDDSGTTEFFGTIQVAKAWNVRKDNAFLNDETI